MFFIVDNYFDFDLSIKQAIDSEKINEYNVRYFDNDGFELSKLEQEYYRENNIHLDDCLNHLGCQKQWIKCEHDKLKVDHSLLLQRYNFTEQAREQLETHKKQFPELNKYLRLRPKWGLDFSLEYYDHKHAIEVLHIELDYNDYNIALEIKERLERRILNTDWVDFTESLKLKKAQWESLPGMEQNDWKARHWGLQKAEFTQKAFQ